MEIAGLESTVNVNRKEAIEQTVPKIKAKEKRSTGRQKRISFEDVNMIGVFKLALQQKLVGTPYKLVF